MPQSMSSTTTFTDANPAIHLAYYKKLKWGAVLAGVAVALAVHLVLSLLGTGIGMNLAETSAPSASQITTGAALWWSVSSLIALALGGWTAAHLSGAPSKVDCALHGALVWAISTLLGVYLLGSAVSVALSGVSSIVSRTAVGMVSGAAVAATAGHGKHHAAHGQPANGVDALVQRLQQEAAQLLRRAADAPAIATSQDRGNKAIGPRPNRVNDIAVSRALGRWFSEEAHPDTQSADHDLLVSALIHQGFSREQAEQQLAQWKENANQLRIKARQAAELAAQTATRLALLGAAALALGALAGILGGLSGSTGCCARTESCPPAAPEGRQPVLR